ncbi:MAG TPA: ATPase [Thermofilum sp.]|nr:ATPase [Thermofilum sp.]
MSSTAQKITILFIIVNIVLIAASVTAFAYTLSQRNASSASQTQDTQAVTGLTEPDSIAILGAAIAVAGSTLAAGIALSSVAKAGLAAYVEKPDVKTWLLILGGLAEGIAIYGLLVAILILGRLG